MPPRLVIGSDTGGTFTDIVRLDETGLSTWKLASTPEDFARGVLDGVKRLLGRPARRPATVELVHSRHGLDFRLSHGLGTSCQGSGRPARRGAERPLRAGAAWLVPQFYP